MWIQLFNQGNNGLLRRNWFKKQPGIHTDIMGEVLVMFHLKNLPNHMLEFDKGILHVTRKIVVYPVCIWIYTHIYIDIYITDICFPYMHILYIYILYTSVFYKDLILFEIACDDLIRQWSQWSLKPMIPSLPNPLVEDVPFSPGIWTRYLEGIHARLHPGKLTFWSPKTWRFMKI